LYYGAGTLSPDQEMGEGNYGIASHRSDRADLLFTPLEEVVLGDKIYLTDLTNVYTYVATWKGKVDPSAVEVLDEVPGKRLITLLTCGDIYATTRLVVQGELASVTPMDQMTEEAANAFDLPMMTY
ncbi:MAG: class A sortase, partial [Enterococcus hulanensis]